MTNDPLFQRWRELSRTGKLTGFEEAQLRDWLAAHPEAQADWEAEFALDEALRHLLDAPVASNFTARVLQAVEREAAVAGQDRSRLRWQPWKRWLPKMAFAVVLLSGGLVSYHEVQAARRAKLARSVETVAKVSLLPSPAILEDFDAIQRLTPATAPAADETLLSLLE